MDKIKNQSSKVSELLFAPETGATYKKTVVLTWDILRETGILLWLIICLVFVGGEWFWKNSIRLGKGTRSWYEGLKESGQEESKSASEMGQSVMAALGTGTANLLYQAKQQLGIEAEPPAPPAPPAKPAAPPAVKEPPSAVATPDKTPKSSGTPTDPTEDE